MHFHDALNAQSRASEAPSTQWRTPYLSSMPHERWADPLVEILTEGKVVYPALYGAKMLVKW